MEFISILSFILLAAAAVALVVFFVTWSRRSKPTDTPPDPHARPGDLDRNARESP